MLINAEEKYFIVFGMIELKRSTLIDVSFKLYQRIFVLAERCLSDDFINFRIFCVVIESVN